jgi:hypothetical protein
MDWKEEEPRTVRVEVTVSKARPPSAPDVTDGLLFVYCATGVMVVVTGRSYTLS